MPKKEAIQQLWQSILNKTSCNILLKQIIILLFKPLLVTNNIHKDQLMSNWYSTKCFTCHMYDKVYGIGKLVTGILINLFFQQYLRVLTLLKFQQMLEQWPHMAVTRQHRSTPPM